MKQHLTFLLIVSLILTGRSQEVETDFIFTATRNAEWIAGLEKLKSKSEMLSEVKEKITNDSIFQISNINIHSSGFEKVERKSFGAGKKIYKSNCECKIIFKLIVKSDEYYLDISEFENTKQIMNLLNESNVDEITIWTKEIASVFFGRRAKCGAILLYSDNQNLKRSLKYLLKQ